MTRPINIDLTLDKFQEIVTSTIDLDELYLCQIELAKKISSYYLEMESIPDKAERILWKASLTWAETLIDIANKRQDDMKRSKVYYLFRKSAEKNLPADMIEKIEAEVKQQVSKNT